MINWISPSRCIPPHKISHEDKLYDLANKFVKNGWGKNQEALVGYFIGKEIQLLTGTHRHGAALLAGLDVLPVCIKPREVVNDAFGDLEKWKIVMLSEVVVT